MIIVCCVCLACLCADKPAEYVNDFEKTPLGKVPDDILVLSGPFSVARVDNNNLVELAGEPIDSYALLFGPAGAVGGEVSARISSASSGRRYPEFGIGCNDAGGYKLWMLPGQARVELRKGDTVKTSIPCRDWKSGAWMHLKLRVAKEGSAWKIQAKVWAEGATEPMQWALSVDDAQAPAPGRASLWGNPYSGQPIRYDDLRFTPLQ